MINYKERKAGNLVSLEKVGDKFLIKEKRFNPNTGEELSEQVETQTVDGIDLLIAYCESELLDLEELKADAKAL